MKNTVLLLLLPLFAQAQSDSLLKYTAVVNVDSATKDQLFIKGRQWIAETWKDGKEVLQVVDKQSGELFGKAYIKSYYTVKSFGKDQLMPMIYRIDVGIYIKDGKYKYEFSNFRPESDNNSAINTVGVLTTSKTCPVKFAMMSQKKCDALYQSMQDHLNVTMKPIINSLIKAMSANNNKFDF